ncbi:MAG: hypothetical protein LBR55_04550 [Bacteroidales bacterium]|jgi:hypothetical protein|nr:hypothetical protein [Bacteroidales bacterium]
MRKIHIGFTTAALGLLFTTVCYSQCRTFAKTGCTTQLAPFIHDGVYNVTELAEGESTELHKILHANRSYRIAICSEPQLPNIKCTVMDSDRNVLFSNVDKNYATVWDFTTQASQQLIIALEVETIDDTMSDTIAQGCIALLIGVAPE